MGPPVGRAATGAVTVVVAQEGNLGAIDPSLRRWVYVGEDPAWALAAESGALQGLERLSIRADLNRCASALRRPYLDWIADLGVRNDSPEWWASELAAKNVYTFLFQRLCAIAAVSDHLEDGLLVVCSTPAQARTVGDLARERGLHAEVRAHDRRLSRLVRETGYGVVRGTQRARPSAVRPVRGGTALDALLVTWVDDRNFDGEGRYRDPHFGPLPRLLRDAGLEVALLARVLPTAPYRETLRRLRGCGERVLVPEAYVTASDRRTCWRAARRFEPAIPGDARVGPVPAARLARELALDQRMPQAEALHYRALMRRLAEADIRPARIIVPWEGHAWETTLFDATRAYLPETEVIAYENLNFSRLALSLYPGRAELGVRPLPDRVVTNGRTFARVLRDEGFPPERVHAGCALRHEHLYDEHGRLKQAERSAPAFVLAAGSIDAAQTIEMVHAVHGAFGADALVKLHPASDTQRIRDAAPAAVRYGERPIGELLTEARAMVYTYSIVPYEALAAGVPPIFYGSAALLDLDQLEPTPAVRWTGTTADELRDALAAAEAHAQTPAWHDAAATAVREAFSPVSASCITAFTDDVPPRAPRP